VLHLAKPLDAIPPELADWRLALLDGGRELELTVAGNDADGRIGPLLRRIADLRIDLADVETRQTSLEEIFVDLVSHRA
jgi:ABC-2 type transport system ATP-binding protein